MKTGKLQIFWRQLLAGSFILMPSVAIAQLSDASLVGICERGTAESYLDVGNVRARIPNAGGLFYNREPHVYIVPKRSGRNAIFSAGFAMAGLVDGEIRSSDHRQAVGDYWPGPLDLDGRSPEDCTEYDRVYDVRAEDISRAISGAGTSQDIVDWPYKEGAPVVDGDGVPHNYNPAAGDYPDILGDQMIWWILNDRGNVHPRSQNLGLGIELRVSAFAFGEHRGRIKDTTFYRYKIKNRNTRMLEKVYAGLFTDIDLGDFDDDFVGSDSTLGLAYYYNKDNEDGGSEGYGTPPPAIGFTVIKGPLKDLGGSGSCSARSGDELGLTGFITGKTSSEPNDGIGLYDTLRSRWWRTGERMVYGDNEWPFQLTQIPTRWIFPGDPTIKGYWSQFNIDGLGTEGVSSDKRGYTSIGPFCLDPGEETEIVFAVIWSLGLDHLDSVRQLKDDTRSIHQSSDGILAPVIVAQTDPEPLPSFGLNALHNFPEPFSESTTFTYSIPQDMHVRLTIYDVTGRKRSTLVDKQMVAGNHSVLFRSGNLQSGVYLARYELDQRVTTTRKFVLVK